MLLLRNYRFFENGINLVFHVGMASKHLRLARLLEIIHIISNSRSWNAKRFADYFEISEKRIYDDIAELNAANLPISFDSDSGGYIFLRETNIPTRDLLSCIWNEQGSHEAQIPC